MRPAARLGLTMVLAPCAVVLCLLAAKTVMYSVINVLAEGPFGIAFENASGEPVVVRTRQVGATSGESHRVEQGESVYPSWGSCALTYVIVKVRDDTKAGNPRYREVSRERFHLCAGADFVIGPTFDVILQCGDHTRDDCQEPQ